MDNLQSPLALAREENKEKRKTHTYIVNQIKCIWPYDNLGKMDMKITLIIYLQLYQCYTQKKCKYAEINYLNQNIHKNVLFHDINQLYF